MPFASADDKKESPPYPIMDLRTFLRLRRSEHTALIWFGYTETMYIRSARLGEIVPKNLDIVSKLSKIELNLLRFAD